MLQGEGVILQYFRHSLSSQLSLRHLLCLFSIGRFTQVLLYTKPTSSLSLRSSLITKLNRTLKTKSQNTDQTQTPNTMGAPIHKLATASAPMPLDRRVCVCGGGGGLKYIALAYVKLQKRIGFLAYALYFRWHRNLFCKLIFPFQFVILKAYT